MGWVTYRRATEEDKEILNTRLRAFCERHGIELGYSGLSDDPDNDYREPLEAAIHWAEESPERMQLLRNVWRRAVKEPRADIGIAWGYIGRQSE